MYTPQDSEASLEAIFRSKAGQLEISLSMKTIFINGKVITDKIFFKYKVRNRSKVSWKRKSNQIRSLFVEPVTNAPLSNPLKFPKYYI